MIKINPLFFEPFDPELYELERLSNLTRDRIEAGRLDDAERTCSELKRQFPEVMDWMECTADIHAARGNARQAIEHYRMCIEYIDNDPDGFDDDAKDEYQAKIDRLAGSHCVIHQK